MLTDQDLDRIQKEIKLMAGNIGSDSQKLLNNVKELKEQLADARRLCGIYAEYFRFNEKVKNLKLPWDIKSDT